MIGSESLKGRSYTKYCFGNHGCKVDGASLREYAYGTAYK